MTMDIVWLWLHYGLEHNIAYVSGEEMEKLSIHPYTKQETAAQQNS